MEETYFLTSSITYAMRGEELLRNSGFRAHVVRDRELNPHGCGYAICVRGDRRAAEALLVSGHIRTVGVREA